MIWIELTVLCIIFWVICYLGTGNDDKNIKNYSSYPDAVQKIISKDPQLNDKIKPYNFLVSFVLNIAVFGVVLLVFGLFIKSNDFLNNFINLIILGQLLNLFDFLIIDMLWWRNSKRVRFTGTKNNPKLYKNPQKHFISFVKGIFVFLIIAVIDGIVLSVI